MENGTEFWLARDLQELLEYSQWRNFEVVIAKAKTACTNAGHAVEDHFAETSKKVDVASATISAKISPHRIPLDGLRWCDYYPAVTQPKLIAVTTVAAETGHHVRTLQRLCSIHGIGLLLTPRMRVLTPKDVGQLRKLVAKTQRRRRWKKQPKQSV